MKYILLMMLIISSTMIFATERQTQKSFASKQISHKVLSDIQKTEIKSTDRANGGIYNSSGSIVIASNAKIVITGGNYQSEGDGEVTGTGSLILDGNFIDNNSSGVPIGSGITMIYNGTSEQELPDGTVETVEVNNTAGAVLTNDLTIGGTLTLTNGNLNLNGQNLILEADATLSETGGRVLGTGSVSTTRSLNGINQNVAGLGFEITEDGNLGSTTIVRKHAVQGPGGINRYFEVSSASPPTNATITFHYNEAELNGVTEANLKLFKSENNGVSWFVQSSSTVNTGNNTVTLIGVNSFSWWTAGDGDATLPVGLSSFTAVVSADNQVVINWTTQSETNVLGFRIYRSNTFAIDDAVQITTQPIAAHNTSLTTNYSFTDATIDYQSPVYYYWLEAVDLDSSSEFFGPVMVSLGSYYLEMQSMTTEIKNHRIPELSWTTNSESSLLVGFDVYRSKVRNFGSAIKVNSNPIYSLNLDHNHTYSFIDESASVGENYFYWIAGLSWDGIVTLYGPNEVFLPNLEISAFSAEVRQSKIVVGWQSEFELEMSGFEIYRSLSAEDNFHKLTGELIPAENEISGASYSFVDNTAEKSKTYKYRLHSINNNSVTQQFFSNSVNLPHVLNLIGNYPNPFNPNTNIKFELSESTTGSLEIYNLKGQKIRGWDISALGMGEHVIVWNGRDQQNKQVVSGVYFCRLTSGRVNLCKKMLMLK